MAISATETTRIRLGSPEDLLAATPYLLGYHPSESIAFLGLASGDVKVTGRYDLSGSGAPRDPTRVVENLSRQGVDSVLLLGYGPPGHVTVDMDILRDALAQAGLPVREALRVTEGRYWSYLCPGVDCCPVEGTAFDLAGERVSAAMTFAGLQALPKREDVAALIAPCEAEARAEVRAALAAKSASLSEELLGARDTTARWDAWRDEGVMLLRRVVAEVRESGRLPEVGDIASLCLLLGHDRIRDEAWALVDENEPEALVPLWVRLVRHAEPEHVPVTASLLSYAAWRAGNGALSRIAVERALEAQPDYRLGLMLTDVLNAAISPTALPPITREWIAATYAEDAACEEEVRDVPV
ncbi:DUF4192 domain-containing protein [Phytomonospora endophytica]|uniref:DUF4192 domain-containing protein n=1 Tax=Phytomonospora endophytica TaxID=714109 RepID=A0A841FSI3_9ACTN|nr:DUF4192 domain-containing protein [Phytomonospora endophytica]MBB6035489.1 hypothetical protein [Phytomonospora endophytica]GIG63758.1 hypothetical protein Pen01_00530 [Phytomonospora endophytica]